MTKFTAKCQICNRVFTNTAQNRANANLANHMKTHGGGPGVPAESAEAKAPRKTYTRKPKATAGVNFCPCCGTNLNAIRVAMSL